MTRAEFLRRGWEEQAGQVCEHHPQLSLTAAGVALRDWFVVWESSEGAARWERPCSGEDNCSGEG